MKPLQGCNPLSLVSVGLDEEDDNDMKDEGLSFDNGQEQNCTFCSKGFLNMCKHEFMSLRNAKTTKCFFVM